MRQKMPRQDNKSECDHYRNLLLDEHRRTTATLLGGGHDTTLLQGNYIHGMKKIVESFFQFCLIFLQGPDLGELFLCQAVVECERPKKYVFEWGCGSTVWSHGFRLAFADE
jgi:hypothetical protein